MSKLLETLKAATQLSDIHNQIIRSASTRMSRLVGRIQRYNPSFGLAKPKTPYHPGFPTFCELSILMNQYGCGEDEARAAIAHVNGIVRTGALDPVMIEEDYRTDVLPLERALYSCYR